MKHHKGYPKKRCFWMIWDNPCDPEFASRTKEQQKAEAIELNGWVIKPTKKSAFRWAQKFADKHRIPMSVFPTSRRKGGPGRLIRVTEVMPRPIPEPPDNQELIRAKMAMNHCRSEGDIYHAEYWAYEVARLEKQP